MNDTTFDPGGGEIAHRRRRGPRRYARPMPARRRQILRWRRGDPRHRSRRRAGGDPRDHRPERAGKSTLLNVISGLYRADRGTVTVAGAKGRALRAKNLARLGIGRTFQNLALFEGLDVERNVAMGRTAHRRTSTVEQNVELARRHASRIVMLRNGVSTEIATRDRTAIDRLYFDAAP